MKKTILTLAAIASVAAANAQREGQVFVNGGVGFNYNKPQFTNTVTGAGQTTLEAKNQSAFVTPSIGYQLNDSWGIGINFNYTLSKVDSSFSYSGFTATATSRTSEIMVGPFVRYTKHLGEHFFVFGQFNAGYIHGNAHTDLSATGVPSTNTDMGYNGFGVNIVPAIGINLSRCWAVTGSFGDLGYRHVKYDDQTTTIAPGVTNTDGRKEDGFGINFGRQFTLGVQWNFGGAMHMHKGHHGMMDDTRTETGDDHDDNNMDHGRRKKKARKDDDE